MIAPLLGAGDVADGGIEPDVPEVTGSIGDFEAEVGSGSGDIPIAEGFAEEVAFEVVGDFGLEVLSVLGPLFEERVQAFEFDEEVFGGAEFGFCAGEGADRIDEIGGRVGGVAFDAIIAVLIGGLALGAGPFDEAVGEEGTGLGIEELLNVSFDDQSFAAHGLPDFVAEALVFWAIGTSVMIEGHIEGLKIAEVLGLHIGDQGFFGAAFLAGSNHDGRAVGVISADEEGSATA